MPGRELIDAEGWVHGGDLGRMDQAKELIDAIVKQSRSLHAYKINEIRIRGSVHRKYGSRSDFS
jgi:hypothetical protein